MDYISITCLQVIFSGNLLFFFKPTHCLLLSLGFCISSALWAPEHRGGCCGLSRMPPDPRCLFSVAPWHSVHRRLNEEKAFECTDLWLIIEILLALTLLAPNSLLLLTDFTDASASNSYPSPTPSSTFSKIQFPFMAVSTSFKGMLLETAPAGLALHLFQLHISGRLHIYNRHCYF